MSIPDPRKPWLWLVTLILGPFAPWIAWLGKLRRRGLAAPGWWLVLAVGMTAVYLALWLLPLRWEIMVAAYLAAVTVSWWIFVRIGAWTFFHFPAAIEQRHRGEWRECLAVGALTVYPTLFAYGFLSNLSGLMEFSIHLPASVYTESLGFSLLYGTPLALLLAGAIRWAGWKPGLRLVLQAYGGAFIALLWFTAWERLHRFGLGWLGAPVNAPLRFEVYAEACFREGVRNAFYVSGAMFSLSFLAGAGSTPAFARRAVFLGMPALLGYANLNLLLGESGYVLAGIRERLYRAGHYQAYKALATVEAARLPDAYFIPYLMRDVADLDYLQGKRAAADRWHGRMLESARKKTWYAPLLDQTVWETASVAACSTSLHWLGLPRIRAAETLDADWYALLGAVSFFHPEWSDFDLKQKLLEVSPFVQLEVPRLGGVPAVAEALDVFGLPFTTCFPDSTRLREALRRGKIPFISFEGRWVPLVGWDACRRGYLIYRHPDSLEKNPWFQAAEKDALFGKGNRNAGETVPLGMLGFLPERVVLRNLHDIGGIGMILGDSNFAPAPERRAAYLAELGDVLYQQNGDYRGAASAYAEAQQLHPADYILARIAYLERLRRWARGPDHGVDAVFRAPDSAGAYALPDTTRARIVRRILNGEIGQYLLLNWYQSAPRFQVGTDSAFRDSARGVFRAWLRLSPNNPAALDSLAAGFEGGEQWDSAASYYRRLQEYFPLGNEEAAFHLSWCLFRLERFEELAHWLLRCESFRGEARYTLMSGALDWQRGKKHRGLEALRKSLKLDKTIPETFEWLERVARATGDSAAVRLHRRWRERALP